MFKHIKQNGVSDLAVATFWLGFMKFGTKLQGKLLINEVKTNLYWIKNKTCHHTVFGIVIFIFFCYYLHCTDTWFLSSDKLEFC